jgi:hypothetical protein
VVPLPLLNASDNRLKLTFDEEWLAANPLARADLEREQRSVKQAGFRLTGFEVE